MHLAAGHGERTAVTDSERSWSYSQLLAAGAGLARQLAGTTYCVPVYLSNQTLSEYKITSFEYLVTWPERGVGPGDRVALLTPPSGQYVVGQWGAWLAGAVVVPLCPDHPPAQLQYYLQDSGARLVLATPPCSQVKTKDVVS